MMQYKSPETVCGIVSYIGRDGEHYEVMDLKTLRDTKVDMFTTVWVGNSQTKEINGKMVTPRDIEMYKVLLFGGTVEGRTVAEYLNENKIPSMVCVATEYGEVCCRRANIWNYPTNVWMKSRWKRGCYRWRTGWSSMRLIRMPGSDGKY